MSEIERLVLLYDSRVARPQLVLWKFGGINELLPKNDYLNVAFVCPLGFYKFVLYITNEEMNWKQREALQWNKEQTIYTTKIFFFSIPYRHSSLLHLYFPSVVWYIHFMLSCFHTPPSFFVLFLHYLLACVATFFCNKNK